MCKLRYTYTSAPALTATMPAITPLHVEPKFQQPCTSLKEKVARIDPAAAYRYVESFFKR